MSIVSVEPTRLFSFRWRPAAAAPGTTTLELDDTAAGTSITITESGHYHAGSARGPQLV